MTPENARRVANGILIVAGAALAIAVWRQPRLRRAAVRALPLLAGPIRPVHVVAALAALAQSGDTVVRARRAPRRASGPPRQN